MATQGYEFQLKHLIRSNDAKLWKELSKAWTEIIASYNEFVREIDELLQTETPSKTKCAEIILRFAELKDEVNKNVQKRSNLLKANHREDFLQDRKVKAVDVLDQRQQSWSAKCERLHRIQCWSQYLKQLTSLREFVQFWEQAKELDDQILAVTASLEPLTAAGKENQFLEKHEKELKPLIRDVDALWDDMQALLQSTHHSELEEFLFAEIIQHTKRATKLKDATTMRLENQTLSANGDETALSEAGAKETHELVGCKTIETPSISNSSATARQLELERKRQKRLIEDEIARKREEMEIQDQQMDMELDFQRKQQKIKKLQALSDLAKMEREAQLKDEMMQLQIEERKSRSSTSGGSVQSKSPLTWQEDKKAKLSSWLETVEHQSGYAAPEDQPCSSHPVAESSPRRVPFVDPDATTIVDPLLTSQSRDTGDVVVFNTNQQSRDARNRLTTGYNFGILPSTTKQQPVVRPKTSSAVHQANENLRQKPSLAAKSNTVAHKTVKREDLEQPRYVPDNHPATQFPDTVAPTSYGQPQIVYVQQPTKSSFSNDSLPKLKLVEFSGDPLDWPDWSGMFLATVDSADITDTLKMNHLKTLVTGKAKEAINGLGYSGDMYQTAWNTLVANFGKPQIVVNAQLRKIYTYPPIRQYDSTAIIKFARIVSNCVNVLKQFSFTNDLHSEGGLNSALRKLPNDMKAKWISYVQRRGLYQAGLETFSYWLTTEAAVQDELLNFGGQVADRNKMMQREKPKTTSFNAQPNEKRTDDRKQVSTQCPMKDGTHRLWHCDVFKKLSLQDRYEKVKALKLCFACLGSQHQIKECKSKPCGVNGCEKRHNRLLHREVKHVDKKAHEEVTGTMCSINAQGILPVVPVTISNGQRTTETLALCDTGASLSFVDTTIKDILQLEGPEVKLSVAGINGTSDMCSEKVKVTLQLDNSSEELTVYSHQNISAGSKVYDCKKLKQDYPHLSVLSDMSINLKDVKMILGQDAYHLHRPLEYRNAGKDQPWAVKTQLGWMMSGPLNQHTTQMLSTAMLVNNADPLTEQVKSWWDIESYASRCSVTGRSKEDRKALEKLEETTRFDGERYEVGLLWKEDNPELPNNYGSALGQLKSLEKRFDKDPELKARYQATIDVDVENKFVRKLEADELEATKSLLQWYVPHHPVINPHKPEKVRRVCNAAAKFQDVALNDKLMTGPDLLQSLIGIIFRFREHEIAVTADIEAMFLQVKVPQADCRVLRFLWRQKPTKSVDVYEYARHIFGAKSSPTCANYALQRVASDNEKEHPSSAKVIRRNFYMDDFVKSVKTESEASQLFSSLRKLLSDGGFELKKWITNSENVMKAIPLEDRASDKSKTFEAEASSSSILGLKWNVEPDNLEVCRGPGKEVPDRVTQRVVLSHVSSLFDPLGIFAPSTIRMRLLLKSIWATYGQLWDDTINEEFKSDFLQWTKELEKVKESSIHRKYFKTTSERWELHVFTDASSEAMCMVAYFRNESNNVTFVIGKCRVAPVRYVTVPKLELQAALYGARLRQLIADEHDIEISKVYHWTDSLTTLQWIYSSHLKQPVFVANRVTEILELTTIDEWRHVAGILNPADIGTRGKTIAELVESDWLTGPAWLQLDEDQWPQNPERIIAQLDKGEPETAFVICQSEPLLDRFATNDFQKIVRTIAYCLRWKIKARRSQVLQKDELATAEKVIFRCSQKESFSDAYQLLEKGKDLPTSHELKKLSPFIDKEGLLRLKGRLHHANLDYEAKHPILLSAKHPVIRNFLRTSHLQNFHEGTEYVRSVLQQHYWIIGLRNALRSVKQHCIHCRKHSAKGMQQFMADLPKERLQGDIHPFCNTGVDYFGPFEVRHLRKTYKRWCCLFTCLVTRAVHIEVVPTMEAESCLSAITRFIARRGRPQVIISDNGTNFVGAAKELKSCLAEWNQSDIESCLAQKQIKWKFNPPGAPHFGGIWERLVRSCKKAMAAVLGNRTLTDDILNTTMCLVEQTLNARPLTSVSNDPNDLNALTPNHFLLGRSSAATPYFPDASIYVDLRRVFKVSQAYADMIWKRWAKEYVPQWNIRSKWNQEENRQLKENDLVWIVDEAIKRSHYKLARVLEVFPGTDGVVRTALVRTADGKFKRPVAKLAPVFYEDVSAAENRAGDVGATDSPKSSQTSMIPMDT